jgi:predicted nucleic acid-binding protein
LGVVPDHAERLCPRDVQPGISGALPVRALVERLAMASKTRHHEFWPDDVSVLDPALLDPSRIHGPRPITDLYLLALAVKHL